VISDSCRRTHTTDYAKRRLCQPCVCQHTDCTVPRTWAVAADNDAAPDEDVLRQLTAVSSDRACSSMSPGRGKHTVLELARERRRPSSSCISRSPGLTLSAKNPKLDMGDIGGIRMEEILAREFVIATNRMHDSLANYYADRSRGNRGAESLQECATTGCSLLSNDMYMQALVEDARIGQEQLWFYRRHAHIITGRAHFEHFLGIERRLLLEAGMDAGVTEGLINQCRTAREAPRRGKFNANAFSGTLEELRRAVCGILAELREVAHDEPSQHQLSRRLTSVFKGVCGCVLVGVDASTLAPTVGLSAAGSAVSIAVGGAIVGQTISDLSGTGCLPGSRLLHRFRRANSVESA
jgi:hypothetical protein